MIRRPPRSTLFPYTTALPISYGGKEDIMCPREQAEANLVSTVERTVKAGGHVLLPVPAVGISQELILILDKDRKSTRLNSSHANISYAVFCLKKKLHVSQLLP